MDIGREQVFSRLTQMLPSLREEYAVSSLGVFGSVARGEGTRGSDVDLLVEFDQPIGLKFFELKSRLEEQLNSRVDLVTKKALKPRLARQVLNEVIDL